MRKNTRYIIIVVFLLAILFIYPGIFKYGSEQINLTMEPLWLWLLRGLRVLVMILFCFYLHIRKSVDLKIIIVSSIVIIFMFIWTYYRVRFLRFLPYKSDFISYLTVIFIFDFIFYLIESKKLSKCDQPLQFISDLIIPHNPSVGP